MKFTWKTGIVCTLLALLISCSNQLVNDYEKESTNATETSPSRQINPSPNQLLIAKNGYRVGNLIFVHKKVTLEYKLPPAHPDATVRIVDSSTGDTYLWRSFNSGNVVVSFDTDETVRLSYQYLRSTVGINEYWDEIDSITLVNRTYDDVTLQVREGGRLLGPSATVEPSDVLTLESTIYGDEVASVGWRINTGNETRLAKGQSTAYTIPSAYKGPLTITFTAYYPDNSPIFTRFHILSVPEQRPDGGYNLYQLYHNMNFFLTSNLAEIAIIVQGGYVAHGMMGGVYPKQDSRPGLKPLLRYINPSHKIHFFTTNPSEVLYLNQLGWHFEGIAGYIFGEPIEGALPFYRIHVAGLIYYASNPDIVTKYGSYPKQLLGYVYP